MTAVLCGRLEWPKHRREIIHMEQLAADKKAN